MSFAWQGTPATTLRNAGVIPDMRFDFPTVATLCYESAMARALVGVALGAVGLVGCSTGAPVAAAVIPSDSSTLARCRVAASQDQPLVTEWPAPYKARLEALLQEGAVAVEYSGCELKIVDRCRVPGTYAWKRTTLSTDTTDIRTEDELFAKLPIGAFHLSGELQTAGSLRVQTTVAGQLALVGKAAHDHTTGAECAEATHLVLALSVGAFELIGGGAVSVKAGVEVGIAEAGGGMHQEKSIIRAAGDAGRCHEATDEAPSPLCSSPLQIFLAPIQRRVPLESLSPLPDE
jgi:hypothetical protein